VEEVEGKMDVNPLAGSSRTATTGGSVVVSKTGPRHVSEAAAAEPAAAGGAPAQTAPEAAKPVPIDSRHLVLQVDNELKMIVATVVDAETGEVVRQIPPSEEVANARYLKAQLERMEQEHSRSNVRREA
jgi:hypothetical protein